MSILRALLVKEFKQIFRNRFILPVIVVVPLVQMIILTYAASLEMKGIRMAVVDEDRSPFTRQLITKFSGSPFFTIELQSPRFRDASDALLADRVDVVLHFGEGFERRLYREQATDLQLVVNAINATEAGLVNAYCNRIIADYNQEIRTRISGMEGSGNMLQLNIIPRFWYNPQLDYKIYMFSGILVIIVTLIGMLLTALNLVREKEMGTTEQINVTPIRKTQFIIAKLLPFWLIALTELAVGLVVGRVLYDLPIRGSLGLLFLAAAVYMLLVLGIGLFLSTISNTQQQLMFVAFFFMITFLLMSGVFTPIESMPDWAQQINRINPLAYFMKVIRMVLLKGSGFRDISRELFSMVVYAALVLTLAVTSYRKTT